MTTDYEVPENSTNTLSSINLTVISTFELTTTTGNFSTISLNDMTSFSLLPVTLSTTKKINTTSEAFYEPKMTQDNVYIYIFAPMSIISVAILTIVFIAYRRRKKISKKSFNLIFDGIDLKNTQNKKNPRSRSSSGEIVENRSQNRVRQTKKMLKKVNSTKRPRSNGTHKEATL